MTPRRKLKKEISLLKHSIKMLPFYADISEVYGDNYFSMDVMPKMKEDLATLEKQLSELPPPIVQVPRKRRADFLAAGTNGHGILGIRGVN